MKTQTRKTSATKQSPPFSDLNYIFFDFWRCVEDEFLRLIIYLLQNEKYKKRVVTFEYFQTYHPGIKGN